jgi:hypothetical protein
MISTEIQRLQQAKADLATSIAAKGVTVPADATLDDYPALVDSISGGDTPLPYDAEVEYLESTGTEYIDTGMKLYMGNTTIKSLFYPKVNDKFLYMARTNTTNYFWGMYVLRSDYGNSQSGQVNISVSINAWHFITDSSNGFWLDDNKLITRTPIMQTTSNNMLLFAASLNGSVSPGKSRCGGFKVITNDAVVLNLIPVRVGQVGYMYDKVSGTLFGNSGTGSFVLGPDKT